MSVTQSVPPATAAGLHAPPAGIGDALRAYRDKVRGGDLGALPAALGLVALAIVFTILSPIRNPAGDQAFFTLFNAANLISQGAAVAVIAMGLTFVLLLGEIDLSAGFAAGVGGAILGVTLTQQGWAWPLALVAALLAGAVIGWLIGVLVARLSIPSFVVTLAAFLALQGLLLVIIGDGGTIRIDDDVIVAINSGNMSVGLSWAFAIAVVAAYAGILWLRRQARTRASLPVETMSLFGARLGVVAVLMLSFTALFTQERSLNPTLTSIKGIPWVVPVILGLVVGLGYLLQRTAWGRHVYAVGGNAEAARRAGINVRRLRTQCFVMCSTLAVLGGVIIVSRDASVSPTTGGSTTLLYAVGAAVIGGISLFGGKGKVRDAVLGALVIAVILNGLPLITESSGLQFMITGAVLLLAATVDALSRRRAAAAGLA